VEPPKDKPKPEEPKPEPTPEPNRPPTPAQPEPCCDRGALARGVDGCVEDAKQAAIDCTLATLVPPYDPWSNAEKLAEYYACLDRLKKDLLDCDKRVKEETGCPDSGTPPDCPSGIA
jgi:hypothetical protein